MSDSIVDYLIILLSVVLFLSLPLSLFLGQHFLQSLFGGMSDRPSRFLVCFSDFKQIHIFLHMSLQQVDIVCPYYMQFTSFYSHPRLIFS